MRLAALLALFAIFTGYTLSVMAGHGVVGFLTLSAREPWALQLLIDLMLMLALFSVWVARDAPRHGLTRWLYVLLTLTMGSMGALFYLVRRELRVRRARGAGGPSIRQVMYADTIVNLVLMVGVLVSAPLVATALRLESQLPLVGVAGLLGLGAASHWIAGRSGSRAAVKVMAAMDGSVLLGALLLATLDPLDAPDWLRAALVVGGMLALLMGGLKVVALRTSHGPAGPPGPRHQDRADGEDA